MLFLILICILPTTAVHVNAVSMTINPYTFSLNVGEGKNFNVTLLNDGQPIDNAYFSLSGIEIDIGESQYYMGNGGYNISILPDATTALLPGTYNVILTAKYGTASASEQMSITINQTDNVIPQLTIIQPNIATFNQTLFFLEILGTDDQGWYDFNVSIGGNTIYYLVNPYPYEEDRGSLLQTNKTFISYSDWYNLKDIKDTIGFHSNKIIISLRDTNLNTNQTVMLLDGDYESPIITWTSHSNGQQIKSREITLSWQISDDSSLADLKLFLNESEFYPNNEAITINTTSISFFLAIPKDQAMFITFTLRAVDAAGNRGENSLILIYDTTAYVENPSPLHKFTAQKDTSYAVYGALAVLAVSAIILFRKVEFKSGSSGPKFSKKEISTALKELDPLTSSEPYQLLAQEWQTLIAKTIQQAKDEISLCSSSDEILHAKMNLRSQLDTIILQIQDNDKNVNPNILITFMRMYNQIL